MTIKDETTTCLIRDRSGLCRRGEVLTDLQGTPVTEYGYEYKLVGATNVKGWGGIDGECQEWAHVEGGHSVIVGCAR